MVSLHAAPRPSQNDGSYIDSAVLSARLHPIDDDKKPSDFAQGLALTTMVAVNGGRGFHPNAGLVSIVVDSGTSDHVVCDQRVPRLHDSVRYYMTQTEPRNTTAGNYKMFATGN